MSGKILFNDFKSSKVPHFLDFPLIYAVEDMNEDEQEPVRATFLGRETRKINQKLSHRTPTAQRNHHVD